MFNFDYISKEGIIEHNPKWPKIPESGKKNVLLDLINHGPDIDKIYLCAKDPYETKYQLLVIKRQSTGLKYLNDPKSFTEYSNDMDNIYKNIEEYNPNKNWKTIIFDNMIAVMLSNKKLNP